MYYKNISDRSLKVKAQHLPQTLIERTAGRRYRMAFDEAAEHEPGGKTRSRAMYQLIPCKFGDIYQHGPKTLAWYCTSGRVKERAKSEAPEWLTLEVDCEGEAIFTFPARRFPEVARWAKPKRRRQVSEKERRRLADLSRRHSPFSKRAKRHPERTISVREGNSLPVGAVA